MNMTLSKRGDYVMRSAIALARAYESGSPRKIRQVVADTEVPRTFASQILADLVRAGLAMSRAGRDGGYWLARPPAEISVLEVVEAAEGPLRAERCALGEGPCRWDAVCPLHETWAAATSQLSDLLARTSLAEVAARDAALEAGVYDAPADAHRSHPVAVEVDDVVQVELAADSVRRALARLATRLGHLVAGAAAQAPSEATARGTRREQPSVPEAECSLEAAHHPAGDGAASFELAWRLRGREVASRFEGTLAVVPVDPARSELQVTGTWRRDGGVAPLSAEDLGGEARRVLRIFLRHLARAIEERVAPV